MFPVSMSRSAAAGAATNPARSTAASTAFSPRSAYTCTCEADEVITQMRAFPTRTQRPWTQLSVSRTPAYSRVSIPMLAKAGFERGLPGIALGEEAAGCDDQIIAVAAGRCRSPEIDDAVDVVPGRSE